MRPDTIDQVIPAIVEHDAVSNHTFEAQRVLREMGFFSQIYARVIGPGCDGRVRPLRELPLRRDGGQWVLYQSSIGSPAADVFAAHPGPKLLDYHNITPAHLVGRWLPPLAEETRIGRAQLGRLAPLVAFAFADSAYNAAELMAAGYGIARVVPVLVEAGNLDTAPDRGLLARLEGAKAKGGVDWLFVGQLAPHKAQHDVVKAFACYRRLFDPAARLHLVGREMGNAYRDALRRLVGALGLTDAVQLPGSVSTAQLAAYYAVADVFVSCSSHEGFCVPIIEAMHRGVPVVAYAAAAVPETVGDAGVLVADKAPLTVAATVAELFADPLARGDLGAAGRARAAAYSLHAARAAFRSAIDEAVEHAG